MTGQANNSAQLNTAAENGGFYIKLQLFAEDGQGQQQQQGDGQSGQQQQQGQGEGQQQQQGQQQQGQQSGQQQGQGDNQGQQQQGEGDANQQQGAPEQYDFKLREGYQLNQEASAKVSEIFKKHNLSNDAANELAAIHMDMMEQYQQAQFDAWNQQRDGWVEQVKKDPELGGAKHDESMAVAKRGLMAFGSPELNELLVQYGLGDHPAVIRAFYKAGLTVKEDKLEEGGRGPRGSDDIGALFFPNTPKA